MGKKEPSVRSHLTSILLLPFTVTVIIPLLLLIFLKYNVAWGIDLPFSILILLIGLSFLILGLVIVISAIRQFSKRGKGTLAPWNPPQKLVVNGVYRYTRNPMISGVVLILLGEVIILGSLPLLFWFILFSVVNYIYFIIGEEPELEKKFGEDYIEYKNNVPRLLPRKKPWSQKS
ncbi:methyltransferase family protein [Salicibibacter kimchii]|uniref:Isoprenylcysteine carboxylmethyltransferase family protein n=1 Tax=Salicibibacter kimchii TaxID=2099786 RepID=A0A345BYK5_9BACI|nr:isoprenylcysteine carboxylmethyltransferase family protein [Salicibibacter kimchii]AXF56036.1 isoprenylcysteine carboxylmethyltransferase family protein [Salicibibacter kimchii]